MDITDLNNVPDKPGVYLWKNAQNQIIYVGKAKNLRHRMKQYFKGMQNSYKTQKLVSLIAGYEYLITASEKEALILERNLIEKHAPEFNILLTDDKRYPYIKVVLREKLEIYMVYRVKSERDKAFYFGPFPAGFGARRTLNLISRLTLYEKGLPIEKASREEWRERFEKAKQLLGSGSQALLREVNDKLEQAAESQQYEIAADLYESKQALEFYQDKQAVELQDKSDIDVIAFFQEGNYLSIAMLFYRHGALLSKKEMVLEITSSPDEVMRQFTSQYYAHNIKPHTLVSNLEFETDLALTIPKKGQYKRVLEIALQNASDNIAQKLQEYMRKEELTLGAWRELSALISMPNLNHILMVDNSTTANTNPVSVFVSYRHGIKQPQEYRKYTVEATERMADVEYMRQGVTKYFSKNENTRPDLLIVDGGIAQVNEITRLLPDQPIIGLVKNDRHVTEALIDLERRRVELRPGPLLHFLRGMQEEVDRYAKSYHARRRQTTLEGMLISIPGIGAKVERKLLDKFQSYAAIYNASVEDLEAVVPRRIAEAIVERLRSAGSEE